MPRPFLAGLWAALCLAVVPAHAYDYERDFDPGDPGTWPVIALIIDDLGDSAELGRRALALPGPVACSILPHTPFAYEFALAAHSRGKEVLLHQPLEATRSNRLLGPGAILRDQTRAQMRATLRGNLDSLRFVSGVNNHMGSLLTQHDEPMGWLMAELKNATGPTGGLFFVDSVTTPASLAQRRAVAARIPNARRDVFLDNVQSVEHIAVQFEMLKRTARRQGYALGIGHPQALTLAMLERALPGLPGWGYRLVSVRELIAVREARERRSGRVIAGAGGDGATTFEQE